MSFVSKETPSGVIDGVNRYFTLLNEVDYIEDIYVDGVIYTSFTREGKILTLTDAPTVRVLVDYQDTTVSQSNVETEYTFGDIKNKVWNLLGARSTSTNFSDSIVGEEINMRSREVWKGRVVNKLNPSQIFRAGDMYFKEESYVIRSMAGGVVTENFEIGASEILMNTIGILESGTIDIGGDIITYTSKTDDRIGGVSGITVNHLTGEKAEQLYPSPSEIDKFSKIECKGIEITREGGLRYEIVNRKLIRLVNVGNDELLKVTYVKRYADMSLDTDVNAFPEDYGMRVIAYIVAGSLGMDKGLPNAQQLLNTGYNSLQEMYGDIGNETNVVRQSIRPQYNPYLSL